MEYDEDDTDRGPCGVCDRVHDDFYTCEQCGDNTVCWSCIDDGVCESCQKANTEAGDE